MSRPESSDEIKNRFIESHPFLRDLGRRLGMLSRRHRVAFAASLAGREVAAFSRYARSRTCAADAWYGAALETAWNFARGITIQGQVLEQILAGLLDIYLGEEGCCDDSAALVAVSLAHFAIAIAAQDEKNSAVRAAMTVTDAVDADLCEERDLQGALNAQDIAKLEAENDLDPRMIKCKQDILGLLSSLETLPDLTESQVNELRSRYSAPRPD